jgi:hypothetical protein
LHNALSISLPPLFWNNVYALAAPTLLKAVLADGRSLRPFKYVCTPSRIISLMGVKPWRPTQSKN